MTKLLKLRVSNACFVLPDKAQFLLKKPKWEWQIDTPADFFAKNPGLLANAIAVLANETPVWHDSKGDVQFNKPGKAYLEARNTEKIIEGNGVIEMMTGRAFKHRNCTSNHTKQARPELIQLAKQFGITCDQATIALKKNPDVLAAAFKLFPHCQLGTVQTEAYWYRGGVSPLAKAEGVNDSYIYNQNAQSPIYTVRYDCEISLLLSYDVIEQLEDGAGFGRLGRGGLIKIV